MKKVLIVIPTLEQGGGQRFVMDLVDGLDTQEFQVRVLVYYKKSNSVFDRFAEERGMDVVYLDKKVGLCLPFFAEVKKEVKRFNPDVIHTHLHSMLYLFTSYKRRHVKLHTMHTLAQKETGGLQGVVRFLAYKVFGVTPVAICDTVADSIVCTHHIAREKIPVVYNGVVCRNYALPKKPSDTIRFVSIGNIYEVKNYSFLLDCFAEVCKEVKNLRLTLVGDGVLRSALEEQAEALGVSDRFTITGVVSDVENYLADADIYVASSVFEGLPLSMLEAMSAGLPVISTNVGGVPDIIRHEENGVLVPFGDKEGYVAAMKKLATDPDQRMAYAEASRKLSQTYDEANTIKGYEALYRR